MCPIIGGVHSQPEQQECRPDTLDRRPNIYFNITSPSPGTFIIALHYKGRDKAILEMDLKIDDLLEKVRIQDFTMGPS